MYAVLSGTLIENSLFKDLKVLHAGGVVYDNSKITIYARKSIFESVSTTSYQGGVFWKDYGELNVSKCYFERCSSGDKSDNGGGNIIWFSRSYYLMDMCAAYRSTDESKSGDAAICSRNAERLNIFQTNFTTCYGYMLPKFGSCTCEVYLTSTSYQGTIEYCNIIKCKGCRICGINSGKTPAIKFTNVLNNEADCFTDWSLSIESCCIFNNKFNSYSNIYSYKECFSDNTKFCSNAVSLTAYNLKNGNREICAPPKFLECETHTGRAQMLTMTIAIF